MKTSRSNRSNQITASVSANWSLRSTSLDEKLQAILPSSRSWSRIIDKVRWVQHWIDQIRTFNLDEICKLVGWAILIDRMCWVEFASRLVSKHPLRSLTGCLSSHRHHHQGRGQRGSNPLTDQTNSKFPFQLIFTLNILNESSISQSVGWKLCDPNFQLDQRLQTAGWHWSDRWSSRMLRLGWSDGFQSCASLGWDRDDRKLWVSRMDDTDQMDWVGWELQVVRSVNILYSQSLSPNESRSIVESRGTHQPHHQRESDQT